MKATVRDAGKTMCDIDNAVNVLSTKCDELPARAETQEGTLMQMEAKVTSLESVALQKQAELLELTWVVYGV